MDPARPHHQHQTTITHDGPVEVRVGDGGRLALLDAAVDSGLLARLTGAAAKVLLALLRHVSGGTGLAWPSVSRLARLAGLHRGTVVKAVDELVREGAVERLAPGHGRRSTTYRIAPGSAPGNTPGSAPRAGGATAEQSANPTSRAGATSRAQATTRNGPTSRACATSVVAPALPQQSRQRDTNQSWNQEWNGGGDARARAPEPRPPEPGDPADPIAAAAEALAGAGVGDARSVLADAARRHGDDGTSLERVRAVLAEVERRERAAERGGPPVHNRSGLIVRMLREGPEAWPCREAARRGQQAAGQDAERARARAERERRAEDLRAGRESAAEARSRIEALAISDPAALRAAVDAAIRSAPVAARRWRAATLGPEGRPLEGDALAEAVCGVRALRAAVAGEIGRETADGTRHTADGREGGAA